MGFLGLPKRTLSKPLKKKKKKKKKKTRCRYYFLISAQYILISRARARILGRPFEKKKNFFFLPYPLSEKEKKKFFFFFKGMPLMFHIFAHMRKCRAYMKLV